MDVVVRTVPVETLWDLRHRLLRQVLPPAAARFAGDESPESLHVGAYLDERLVGAATLHVEPYEGRPAWKLRGMAVEMDTHRTGVGRKLLARLDAHVIASPIQLLWCHARVPAIGFYERCGWVAVSDVYEIPTAGPHRTMIRRFESTL